MRKTLCSIVASFTLLLAVTPLLATPKDHPKFAPPQDIAPEYAAQAKKFEERYPRIVQDIRATKLSFHDFDVMWKSLIGGKFQVLFQMGMYEAERADFSQVKATIDEQATATDINCGDCWFVVNTWVDGCVWGGGDDWTCFVLGEQMRCLCENAACGYSNFCNLEGGGR